MAANETLRGLSQNAHLQLGYLRPSTPERGVGWTRRSGEGVVRDRWLHGQRLPVRSPSCRVGEHRGRAFGVSAH